MGKEGRMNAIHPVRFLIMATLANLLLLGCALLQELVPGLTLSDSNIVDLLDRLDESEMDAARLAQTKASDPQVQAFAGRVLNEHRELTEANGRLAGQLSLQPEPSSLVSHLQQAHEQAMRKLRALSGPAFDRAYVEHEIRQHVWAFNFLETTAESESNLPLKQELVRTGPDLLSHISAARALERHLGPDQRESVASR